MTGGRVPTPRPWISGLDPYAPGRPAADEASSLASNESSFGASPAVAAAVAWAVKRIHRYPDPLAGEVRGRLAERLEVPPEQVLVGNGSDELIQVLALVYASAGGSVVCADPPYRLHELVPRALGASSHRVPLKQWTHDLSAMARVQADLAPICNPHNPTGTVVPRTEIAEFALGGSAGLVVLDEAFEDAGYRTVPSQTNFVLVLTPDEDGPIRRLGQVGVRVRAGSTLGAPGTVRVTVPSEEGFALLNRALVESPV